MTAEKLIATLRGSGNRLLESMADSLDGATRQAAGAPGESNILGIGVMRPLKDKMETFLRATLAYMTHDGKGLLLSSNPLLLHHIEKRRAAKNKNRVVRLFGRSSKFDRILKSRDRNLVRTWDVIENDKHEIPVDSKWNVRGWIAVTSDNVELLSKQVNDILSRERAK